MFLFTWNHLEAKSSYFQEFLGVPKDSLKITPNCKLDQLL